MKENRCSSMACAFPLAGCPRSTLQDFVAIVELKKVVSRKLDLVLHDQEVNSVRDLEVVCRKRLQRYIPAICHYLGNAGQLAQNNLLLILTIQHYSSHSSYIRKIWKGDINTSVFLFTYYAFSRFQHALCLTQCYKRVKKNKSNSQNWQEKKACLKGLHNNPHPSPTMMTLTIPHSLKIVSKQHHTMY